jgi:hypothetical protein
MKTARRLRLVSAGVVLVLATAGIAYAHVVEQKARLRGDRVAPDEGDPNGIGRANLKSADEAGRICFRIRYRRIKRATGGHIHEGGAGESGPIVVTLFGRRKASPVEGCRTVNGSLIQDIQDNPQNYYVQLHNRPYPDGALRGQIRNTN